MKRLIVAGACVLLMAFLIVSSAAAQGRSAPSGAANAGRGTGTGTAAASGVASSGSYSSSTTSASSYSGYSGGGMGNRGWGASTPGGYPQVNISGTSFNSFSLYQAWENYYSQLIYTQRFNGCTGFVQGFGYMSLVNSTSYCGISPTYFTRFYRNVEPLMTPALLKFALRQPLLSSRQMLQAIDELETMLADSRAGKPVDKAAIAVKSREIREYAKSIRKDRTLTLYDIRDETDVLGGGKLEAFNLESIARLRELALDINLQLQNLSSLSSSSTMSVESYKQPSFESMTKGVEKLCKAIENSSKRL